MDRSRYRQRSVVRILAAAVVAGGAATIFSAPGAAAVIGDPAAISACERDPYSENSTLRAAYDTTVGELMSWLDSRQPPSWGHVVLEYEKGRRRDEPMSLCWIDGVFYLSGPPEAFEGRSGKGRAAIVVDASGEAFPLFFGLPGTANEARFAPVRPSAEVR